MEWAQCHQRAVVDAQISKSQLPSKGLGFLEAAPWKESMWSIESQTSSLVQGPGYLKGSTFWVLSSGNFISSESCSLSYPFNLLGSQGQVWVHLERPVAVKKQRICSLSPLLKLRICSFLLLRALAKGSMIIMSFLEGRASFQCEREFRLTMT